MKKIHLIFITVLLLSWIDSFSQNKYDLNQFWNETKTFVKQPTNWQSNDWLKLGIVTASTIGLMFVDEDIRDFSQSNKQYKNSFTAEFGRVWGEPYTTAVIGGAFFLQGILSENKLNKKVGFEIYQSFVYTSLSVGILKIGLGRSRPYTGSNAFAYSPLHLNDNDYWSLPSGHTSTAFSLSTVLANNTNSNLLKGICYLPAVITAVSRVYQNFHWTSDVVLGAAIGYFIAKFVSELHDNKMIKEIEPKQLINFSFSF